MGPDTDNAHLTYKAAPVPSGFASVAEIAPQFGAPSRNAFFFSTNKRMDNAGDILINRNLLAFLRSFGSIYSSTGTASDMFLDQLHLSASERAEKNQWTLALKAAYRALASRSRHPDSTYLVLTPGDIGGDGHWQHRLRLLALSALRKLGVRIIHLGLSFNAMTPRREALEAKAANLCHFQGFRDKLSIEQARRMGIRHPRYFPDLALLSRYVRREPIPGHHLPRIALSFRADNLSSFDQTQLSDALISLLRELRGKIASPVVLCSQVIGDLPFMKRLAENQHVNHQFTFHETTDLAQLDHIYDHVDVVFSNRLHALLVGAARGAIPVAMTNSTVNRKIVGLFQSHGLDDLLYEYPDLPKLDAIFSKQSKASIDHRIESMFAQAQMDALSTARECIFVSL